MKRNKYSRRDFFNVTAGSVAAAYLAVCASDGNPESADAASPATQTPAVTASTIPLGVQMYCFRHLLEEDFAGTFAKIAELGFENVEYAGYYDHSAAELRKMMDDLGVNCIGTHLGVNALIGDELQRTIDFNLGIGNPYLIVAGIAPEYRDTKDTFMKTLNIFNEAAEKLKPHGLRTGYHCHAYSFNEPFEGETIWDLFANNTTPNVLLQLDVGNAANGGADIPEVIRKHPGRTVSMHVKPFTPGAEDPNDPFIGDDGLDWPLIFELSETVGGIEAYVIEYEQEAHDPMVALKQNLENVKRIQGRT